MSENKSDKEYLTEEKDDFQHQQRLWLMAMKVVKYANALANGGPDLANHQIAEFRDRTINMISKIYGRYGLTGNNLAGMDLEEQMELVFSNNDVLMNGIKLSLDEAAGLATTNKGSGNLNAVSLPVTSHKLLLAETTVQPQLKFKERISNYPGMFIPKIKNKPHSLKPLAILLDLDELGDVNEFDHPYEFELESFTPDPKFLTVLDVVPSFPNLQETPLLMIDTEDGLKSLLEVLLAKSVIAVDLEAHSYRSFQGITCLMQISTSNTDFIIDTLELRDELQLLNEVFCNPMIVKIFHGADMDIQWLQRDFGIYVVNLFDTYRAAKLLGFAKLSLSYLLHHYCQVNTDKRYQLADWRIRPLPEQMISYARQDTHYLGYIYEMMKMDLKKEGMSTEKNLLTEVWQMSRLVCLKRYQIPRQDTVEAHLKFIQKTSKTFNERQLFVLKELFSWRDQVARDEDESIAFVLPDHMMLHIADVLPREIQGILACCSPVPPLVRRHLLHLHRIIQRAREIIPFNIISCHGQSVIHRNTQNDPEDPFNCKHDLKEIRDDLPTLLNQKCEPTPKSVDEFGVCVTAKSFPHVPVVAELAQLGDGKCAKTSFLSPYARYLCDISLKDAAAPTLGGTQPFIGLKNLERIQCILDCLEAD